MKTAAKPISRTFTVIRRSRDAFRVAGRHCWSVAEAVLACEKECEARGMPYDFDTYDQTREGLEALKIGEAFTVEPEKDDE